LVGGLPRSIYKKFAEINEIIAPGNPVYIFGTSSNSWRIITGITDKDINKLRIGDSARVKIDALPEKYLKARVSEIAGAIDPISFTYEVELQIEGNESKLFSGMVASVRIYPKSEGSFKAIPIKSIVNANEMTGEIYYVNDSDVAENRTVKISQIWNEVVLIESGLDDINEVILDGVEYVYKGAKVNVQSAKEFNLGDL
jgi:multidrug efflux pump subunit AcrA (membrane-fusion protein)